MTQTHLGHECARCSHHIRRKGLSEDPGMSTRDVVSLVRCTERSSGSRKMETTSGRRTRITAAPRPISIARIPLARSRSREDSLPGLPTGSPPSAKTTTTSTAAMSSWSTLRHSQAPGTEASEGITVTPVRLMLQMPINRPTGKGPSPRRRPVSHHKLLCAHGRFLARICRSAGCRAACPASRTVLVVK